MKAEGWLCLILISSGAAEGATPCVQVPASAFRQATSPFPDGPPASAWLSGSGKTLGILLPEQEKGHRLLLLRGEKIVSDLYLAPPKGTPFPRPPSFVLADDGNVAILKTVEFFAVYVAGTMTAVVEGDWARAVSITTVKGALAWAPSLPSQRWLVGSKELLEHAKEHELPPLLVSGEFDGSGQRALLRLDPKRLTEEDPEPLYQGLAVAPRKDGKLWLVGPWSGEVMLVTNAGRILRRFDLPLALKRPEDDPETRKKMEDETEREAQARFERSGARDAARKPPVTVQVRSKFKTRFFRAVYAHGNDVVLVMSTADPPAGSLVLYRDAEEDVTCLVLPGPLANAEELPRNLAVTEDGLWFMKPFGTIPWEEIEALLPDHAGPKDASGDRPQQGDKGAAQSGGMEQAPIR